jgi:hypothetical protein
MGGEKIMTDSEIRTKIEHLKAEVAELEEEKELTNDQSRLDFIEETIYNTKDSIKRLENYV